jgi:arginine/lysine/ornithine decarboxylase
VDLPEVPPTVRDLLAYRDGEQASFHMPGHKQRGGFHRLAPSILGESALRNDVSEMGGFDYLHAPEGSIAEAQKQCAQIFGAHSTYFLINGSTVGNLAAILSHASDGDTVVALRGSHRSVYSAIGLSGANPLYLPIEFDAQHQGWFVATPPKTLPAPPRIIHVTRPNYYGMAVDLAPYRAMANEYDAVLIVDEAHGTHFGVDPRLPASALQCGADIVIQSTHKTLSALTQASMLHVGADPHGRVNRTALAQSLAMLQSSSPSALLSVSLDLAAHEHARDGFRATRGVIDLAIEARRELNERLTRCTLLSFAGVANDPTKLVLDTSRTGLSGFDARTWLRAEHGVGVELADHRRIVCSLTVGDDDATTQLLIDALLVLDQQQSSATQPTIGALVDPEIAMNPRVALQQRSESVTIADASRQICAEYLIPYPPGIPLVAPGERITTEVLTALESFQQSGARIVGPADPTLQRVQVVTGTTSG